MAMYLLDTNHLTMLQRGGIAAQILESRLAAIDPTQLATTIISYHEQTQGWLGEANRLPSLKPEQQVNIYQRLEATLQMFSGIPVLGYDLQAAQEFQRLRKLHRRIGAMDLRIAAIAITQNAILLTQNLKDFTDIQDLKVEDWSY
jgi:tRNA(fMet)-specific endonuclease VapC